MAGGPLIVDLIAVPIVVVAGVGIGRVVPRTWRRYAAAASALTVLVTLVAFPFLTALGRRPDNPSLLDRNYWAGYLAVLGLGAGRAAAGAGLDGCSACHSGLDGPSMKGVN